MTLTKEQKIGIGVGVGAAVAAVVVLTRKAGAAPPVVCTPGDEKCIGLNWCRCKDDGTGWIVVIPNASECAAPLEKAILYGKITDAQTHLAIANALIQLTGYSARATLDGNYRIENIEPGTYEGSVSADGYETYYL